MLRKFITNIRDISELSCKSKNAEKNRHCIHLLSTDLKLVVGGLYCRVCQWDTRRLVTYWCDVLFIVEPDELEASGAREIQLDDDLAMTQTQVNTKCPVTMKEMKRPVRNKHCGHSYDYDGAKELIRNRQQAR